MLLTCMSLLCVLVNAQTNYELEGLVVDENNEPLIGASVLLFPIKKGTVSDING